MSLDSTRPEKQVFLMCVDGFLFIVTLLYLTYVTLEQIHNVTTFTFSTALSSCMTHRLASRILAHPGAVEAQRSRRSDEEPRGSRPGQSTLKKRILTIVILLTYFKLAC